MSNNETIHQKFLKITTPRERLPESGLYLITMGVFSVVLLGLCALAIGLGSISFNKSLQQNSLNLAGLAAMEAFVATQPTSGDIYVQKATAARDRAKAILETNQLKGVIGTLEYKIGLHGAPDDDGEIVFGKWYEKSAPPDTCEPPCFFPNPSVADALTTETANAIQINVNTHTSPLFIPFGSILGTSSKEIASSAVAVVAPRCVALLLDVSGSVAGDTHSMAVEVGVPADAVNLPAEFAGNQLVILAPEKPGVFAVRTSAIDGNCAAMTSIDELMWCNTRAARALNRPVDPEVHYQSDYIVHETSSALSIGDVYVDAFNAPAYGYFGPEPYTSIFHALNAGVRLLAAQASPSDLAMMLIFSGSEIDRIPRTGTLTNEFDLLAQLTNLDNIGRKTLNLDRSITVSPKVTPNAVSEGWFFIPGNTDSENGTNLVYGIQAAIEQLSDTDNCPATAKRVIILASDGLANCSVDINNTTINCDPENQSWYPRYLESRAALLGPVLQKLRQEEITFTVLLAGSAVGPNFLNIKNPNFSGNISSNDPEYYLSQEQAIALGYGGVLQPPSKQFFDSKSYVDGVVSVDSQAVFDGAADGFSNYVFRDPNSVLGELAFQTGGVFCPFLPLDVASHYTNDGAESDGSPATLKLQHRTENAPQTVAIEYIPQAEMAAKCVVQSIGADPFALRYDGD